MRAEGADLIDIGGESTRPGAKPVSAQEELRRVLPILKKLRTQNSELRTKSSKLKAKSFKISLDSRKPEVVRECLPYIDWINDVSGLADPEMRKLVAKSGKKAILMHSTDLPVVPGKVPRYKNLVQDLLTFFKKRIQECEKAGIKKSQLILDPGIGFGKNLEQNLQLLANLKEFEKLAPVCLGASRKSFIGKIDGSDIEHRLGGSLAAAILGYQQGVRIFRVHDVGETVQALRVFSSMNF